MPREEPRVVKPRRRFPGGEDGCVFSKHETRSIGSRFIKINRRATGQSRLHNVKCTKLLCAFSHARNFETDESVVCLRCLTAGGADRDRTDDLKLAKLALSQLSYGPGR